MLLSPTHSAVLGFSAPCSQVNLYLLDFYPSFHPPGRIQGLMLLNLTHEQVCANYVDRRLCVGW